MMRASCQSGSWRWELCRFGSLRDGVDGGIWGVFAGLTMSLGLVRRSNQYKVATGLNVRGVGRAGIGLI